jgi:2-polyprenyl-3-methyl-5-hydroxy-6-metoxy-1,4-benzoquinol methylase
MKLTDLVSWVPKWHHSVPRETWDAEYASGYWDYLQSLGELAHYSIIVGYCRFFESAPAILDVGCGTGTLQKLLRPFYASYVGIDLSEEAIARAVPTSDANTSFACADASAFVPPGKLDVVIFNECLSYFEQPLALVRRYETCLAPGGVIVASNVIRRRTRAARAMLASSYVPLDRVTVANAAGVRWEVQMIRPASAPPQN